MDRTIPPTPSASTRCLVALALALTFIASAVLAAHAALPFDVLRAAYDYLAPDGEAAFFSQSLHTSLASRAGVPALLFGLAGCCSLIVYGRLCRSAEFFTVEFRDFATDLKRSAGHVFEAKPSALTIGAVLIICSGAAIRLAFLHQPLRYDEASTYLYFASQPLHRALSTVYEATNHPLNTALIHVSARLFGDDLWALRLPVLLAGIAVPPLVYWAGSVTFGRAAGLIAGAIVAVSWIAIQYSIQARGYMPGLLFIALLYGLSPYIARTDNRVGWLLFSIAAALAEYSVPVMALGIVGASLWLAFLIGRQSGVAGLTRRLPRIASFALLAVGLTLMLYAPIWLLNGWAGLRSYRGDDARSLQEIAHLLPVIAAEFWHLWSIDWPLPIQILVLGALAASVVSNLMAAALMLITTGSGLALVAVMGAYPPSRSCIFVIVPLSLAAGATLVRLYRRLPVFERRQGLTALVIAALFVAAVIPRMLTSRSLIDAGDGSLVTGHGSTFVGPSDIVVVLMPLVEPGDRVFAELPTFALEYYLTNRRVCADSVVRPMPAPLQPISYNRICRTQPDNRCQIPVRGQADGGPCVLPPRTTFFVARDNENLTRLRRWAIEAGGDSGTPLAVIDRVGPWVVYRDTTAR